MDALQNTGLQEDCPFSLKEGAEPLSPESVKDVSDEAFVEYAGRLNSYLQARPLPSVHCASLEHIEKPTAFLGDVCHTEMKILPCTVSGATMDPWSDSCHGSREAEGHACKQRVPNSCSTELHA